MITPLYAAILALIFVGLSVRIISIRRGKRIALGTGDDAKLIRATRVHANFAEYVPMALIILGFMELGIGSTWLVHTLCLLLVVGRLLHAYGLSQVKETLKFRVAGVMLTFLVIILASVRILLAYF